MKVFKKDKNTQRKKRNTRELKYITALENNVKYLERIDELQRNTIQLQNKLQQKTEECIELKDKLEIAKFKKVAKV